MIEKIAKHIADYSPRLRSNIKALYQVCDFVDIWVLGLLRKLSFEGKL